MENTTIDNKDKYFKGQMSDENFILFFRKHWITLISVLAMFVVMCVVAVVFVAAMIAAKIQTFLPVIRYFIIIGSLAGFLIYVHWFFLRIFEHFLTICILTDHRVLALIKTTYALDFKETAGLGMIQDVKKNQEGLIRNFLRYGNIIITFSASSAIMILSNVPNVEFHFRALMRARQNFIIHRRHEPIQQEEQIKIIDFVQYDEGG